MKTSKSLKKACTKGVLVHTASLGLETLNVLVATGEIGKNSKPIGSQIPLFKDKAIVFCSYVCEGYSGIYGNREGIIFETDSPVVYACPADSFELMRDGTYLPGYERFVFSSIEAMLKKYPTAEDFKRDFREYFRRLKPTVVHPELSIHLADLYHRTDYCLRSNWNLRCNEITFSKPLKIKNPKIFSSREELDALLV
ncbi:hypothetical protein HZA97_04575 [Candidatus Woesearchaeota archaeon]|nr:hypothetical protein [Candidatus Woesearchaeota archaeon]